jgi:hypothetical protein
MPGLSLITDIRAGICILVYMPELNQNKRGELTLMIFVYVWLDPLVLLEISTWPKAAMEASATVSRQ